MNNKIVSTKTTSAIFLAIVLIAGTITLSYPSFMTNANAQTESYYGGIDDEKKSYGNNNYYEQLPEYSSYDEKDNNHYKSQKNSDILKKINVTITMLISTVIILQISILVIRVYQHQHMQKEI